jgi:hypothetical protein
LKLLKSIDKLNLLDAFRKKLVDFALPPPPPPPPPPSAAAGGARGWLALPLPFSSEEYLRTESMDEERGRLGSEVKGGGGETREVGRMGVDDKEGANTGFSGRGSWLG